MRDIPREQIIKRLQILPESLQNEIFSEKSADAIIKHCALRDIPNDKMPIVGRLSTRVLLGYLRPELFYLEIQKETGMDMQKAQLIAQDLDTEIFSAVRLELKKLYPPTIQTPTVQSWRAESQPNLQSTTYNLQAKPRYVIPIPEKFLRPETRSTDVVQKFNIERPDLQQPINGPTPVPSSKTNSSGDDLKSAGGDQVSQKPADQYGEARPPTTNDLPQPQTQKATNSATTGGVQQAEVKPQEPPISPPVPTLKANEASEVNEAPSFKPIVPLPTFIQTQFRTTQVSNAARPENQYGEVRPPTTGGINYPEAHRPQIAPQTNESQRAEAKPQGGDQVSTETGAQESSLANDPRIKSLISKFTSSSTKKPKPPTESPYREKI